MLTFGGGLGTVSPPRTQFFTPNVVGTITPLLNNTTSPYSSLVFPGHTSPSGNVLILFFTRAVVNSPGGFDGVTWGGDSLTEILDFERAQPPSASGSIAGWAGVIRRGKTGAQSIVVTPADVDFQDLIGWAISFDRIDAAGSGNETGASVQVSQAAHSVAVTPTSPASLIVSAVAVTNENGSPMAVNPGWTILGAGKTGNAGGADIAAVLATRLAGDTSSKVLTASNAGGLVWDEWGGIALDLIPAA